MGNISYFQKLHFALGSSDNKDNNLLHIMHEASNTTLDNFESFTITGAPEAKLNNGDKVILIRKGGTSSDAAPVPSLKGNSGMLERGWKAEAASNLTIDLSLNGWIGKQRGISGGASFRLSF